MNKYKEEEEVKLAAMLMLGFLCWLLSCGKIKSDEGHYLKKRKEEKLYLVVWIVA